MSIFDILEGRMQEIFEGGRTTAPFEFKRLAHIAVRQMKRGAVKIDGRKLAPTLYTMLINPADDKAMGPLYRQVTDELVDFIGHEAQNDGLEMSDVPIVRFIADQSVARGKVDVIAEVVPRDILEDLRREEDAYIRSRTGVRDRGSDASRGAVGMNPAGGARRESRAEAPRRGQPAPAPDPVAAGMSQTVDYDAPTPGPSATERRAAPTSCQLRDTASGRVWRISAASTVIGREGSSADLVLSDTNVSRRHAQLSRDDAGWHIVDLGSTNGTRVNGLRVEKADLRPGDTITLGITDLAFEAI